MRRGWEREGRFVFKRRGGAEGIGDRAFEGAGGQGCVGAGERRKDKGGVENSSQISVGPFIASFLGARKGPAGTDRVDPKPEPDGHAKRVADGADDEGEHPALAIPDELAEEGEEEEEVKLRGRGGEGGGGVPRGGGGGRRPAAVERRAQGWGRSRRQLPSLVRCLSIRSTSEGGGGEESPSQPAAMLAVVVMVVVLKVMVAETKPLTGTSRSPSCDRGRAGRGGAERRARGGGRG